MEGDCNFWEVFEEHLRIFGKRLGSVWEAFGKRLGSVWKAFGEASGAVQGCYWSVAGILCMEDIWNFWEVFGERWGAIGGVGGRGKAAFDAYALQMQGSVHGRRLELLGSV